MKRFIHAIKQIILFFSGAVFFWTRLLPLKNWIVFESNPDFNDESYWMCKKLMEAGYQEKYRFFWILRDNSFKYVPEDWPVETIQLSPANPYQFFRQQYVLRRSKYIFESCYFLKKYDKRQFLVNLYHGMQMKNIKTVIRYMKDYDYFANGTHYSDEYYTHTIHIPAEKLLHFGMIRNDELIKKTDYLTRMGIKSENISKVVLWMPTYRQHVVGETPMTLPETQGLGLPFLYDDAALKTLNEELRKNRVLLLVKAHQSQVLGNIRIGKLSNIRLITTEQLQQQGVQLYSLIGESDSLITDYSSVYYDYVLLGKPIALACDDLAQYEGKIGFIFSEYEHPGYEENVEGVFVRSFAELIRFCTEYSAEDWRRDFDVDAMQRRYHDVLDFHSGELYLRFCKDVLGM